MTPPFPGMDPYVERRWSDFHGRFVVYAAERIQEQLPADLLAMIDERLIVADADLPRPIRPDTYVVEYRRPADRIREPGGVAQAEPVILRFHDDPERQTFLEIREMEGGRLVTSVELVSPSNKTPGAGRGKYLQKQEEVLAAHASLVEIDLVRGGACVLALPEHRIPYEHRARYHGCVRRAWRWREAEIYSICLQDRLPIHSRSAAGTRRRRPA